MMLPDRKEYIKDRVQQFRSGMPTLETEDLINIAHKQYIHVYRSSRACSPFADTYNNEIYMTPPIFKDLHRFILGHELGHVILDHPYTPPTLPIYEDEADCFSKYLTGLDAPGPLMVYINDLLEDLRRPLSAFRYYWNREKYFQWVIEEFMPGIGN